DEPICLETTGAPKEMEVARLSLEAAKQLRQLGETGPAREAEALAQKALEKVIRRKEANAESAPVLAGDCLEMGYLFNEAGAPAKALECFRRGWELAEGRVKEGKADTKTKAALAYCSYWAGKLANDEERSEEALRGYRRSAEVFEELVRAES